jgi:hypothetical protein
MGILMQAAIASKAYMALLVFTANATASKRNLRPRPPTIGSAYFTFYPHNGDIVFAETWVPCDKISKAAYWP